MIVESKDLLNLLIFQVIVKLKYLVLFVLYAMVIGYLNYLLRGKDYITVSVQEIAIIYMKAAKTIYLYLIVATIN